MATQGWTQDDAFDWDKISEGPPPPLENGIYRATVVKADPEKTGKGDPAISLQLQVTAKHGSDEPLKRKMYDKLVATAEAAFRLKQCARAVGVDLPARNNAECIGEFAASLVGQEVWIRTKQQTYEGKTNARVDMYVADDKLEEVLSGKAPEGSAEAPAPAVRRKRNAA